MSIGPVTARYLKGPPQHKSASAITKGSNRDQQDPYSDSLPKTVRSADIYDSFKTRLKTHLFDTV